MSWCCLQLTVAPRDGVTPPPVSLTDCPVGGSGEDHPLLAPRTADHGVWGLGDLTLCQPQYVNNTVRSPGGNISKITLQGQLGKTFLTKSLS